MPIWLAIGLTLAATTCMNLGLVLQKKGIADLAKNSSHGLRGVARSPIWRLGMFLLVAGYALFMAANFARRAPISLLQPIYASGVAVIAVLAVLYLKERFGTLEWLGVFLMVGGVILLGASAESQKLEEVHLNLTSLLIYLATAAMLILAGLLVIRWSGPNFNVEILFGIVAGLLLGFGFLNTKTFALAWKQERFGVAVLAMAGLLLGMFGGLTALQKGFQRGRALIITSLNMVVNQVAVILGGMYCFGEHFPREPRHFAERLLGLAVVLVGTIVLARFSSPENLGANRERPLTVPEFQADSGSLYQTPAPRLYSPPPSELPGSC